MTSVWILVLIAMERFLAVAYPFRARQLCTVRMSVYSMMVVFLLSFICTFPKFLLIHFYGIASYVGNINLWSDLILLFTIPFFSLLVLNVAIFVKIRKGRQSHEWLTSSSSNTRSENVREHTNTVVVLVLVLVFFLTNLFPFSHTLSLLFVEQLTFPFHNYWLDLFESISVLMIALNATINIFIYYLRSAQFRKELRNLRRNLRCQTWWHKHCPNEPQIEMSDSSPLLKRSFVPFVYIPWYMSALHCIVLTSQM